MFSQIERLILDLIEQTNGGNVNRNQTVRLSLTHQGHTNKTTGKKGLLRSPLSKILQKSQPSPEDHRQCGFLRWLL